MDDYRDLDEAIRQRLDERLYAIAKEMELAIQDAPESFIYNRVSDWAKRLRLAIKESHGGW